MLWIRTSVSMTVWRHLVFRIFNMLHCNFGSDLHAPVHDTKGTSAKLIFCWKLISSFSTTGSGWRSPWRLCRKQRHAEVPNHLNCKPKLAPTLSFFPRSAPRYGNLLTSSMLVHNNKEWKLEDWYPGSGVRSLKSEEVSILKSQV